MENRFHDEENNKINFSNTWKLIAIFVIHVYYRCLFVNWSKSSCIAFFIKEHATFSTNKKSLALREIRVDCCRKLCNSFLIYWCFLSICFQKFQWKSEINSLFHCFVWVGAFKLFLSRIYFSDFPSISNLAKARSISKTFPSPPSNQNKIDRTSSQSY
jgi:hypothetical protein